MPSSLIIVALVGAWLLVLVPIVARRRQEVARTADSTLAARVVRSGGVRSTAEEESSMLDSGEAGPFDRAGGGMASGRAPRRRRRDGACYINRLQRGCRCPLAAATSGRYRHR